MSHCSKTYGQYTDYAADVARGNIGEAEPFYSFGKLETSGSVSDQMLWGNGVFTIPPATGVQLTIVSDSADDDLGGIGIEQVEINYLDTNLDPKTEIVTLDGLTPVTTIATDIRFMQCGYAVSVGSNGKAVGNISFTAGGVTYNYLTAGEIRCTSSARMVPRGKRAVVWAVYGSSLSGTSAAKTSISLNSTYFQGSDYTNEGLLFPIAGIGMQDGSEIFTSPIPFIIPAGSVLAMYATTDKGALITGSWIGWLEKAL